MSAVGTLLKKELTDCLRDRRTLVMMLVVPVLLYPVMLMFIGYVTVAGKARLASTDLDVAVTSEAVRKLFDAYPPPHTFFKVMSRADGEAALGEKRVWAVVDAPANALELPKRGEQAVVTVVFTRRQDKSTEARDRLSKSLRALGVDVLAARLEQANLPRTFAEPLKTAEIDVDLKDFGPLIASRILPTIMLVMLLLGSIYPAIDVTAGEKERGTLETLLVAPVRPGEVMTAKYLTVAIIGSMVTVLNLVAMAITFGIGVDLGENAKLSLSFDSAQVAMLLLSLVPASFMVSGVSLTVASLARSFREAQSLMSPLMIVGTLPSLVGTMPGMELSHGTALVPLLNVVLAVKAIALKTAHPLDLALVLLSTAVCGVFAVRLASRAFQSEALRFGGAESWRELFGLGPKA